MVSLRAMAGDAPERAAVERWMETAFPANERIPLAVQLSRPGSELLLIEEDGALCGFMSLLTWQDLTHILFFAVDETRRGQGIGARALAAVRAQKPGQRIIADLERPSGADEDSLRRRRYDFYLRNGYAPTQIAYTWRGERYVILSSGGNVTPAEFDAFWARF